MPKMKEAADGVGGALEFDDLGGPVDPRVSTPSPIPQAKSRAAPTPPLSFVALRTENGAIFALERLGQHPVMGGRP